MSGDMFTKRDAADQYEKKITDNIQLISEQLERGVRAFHPNDLGDWEVWPAVSQVLREQGGWRIERGYLQFGDSRESRYFFS